MKEIISIFKKSAEIKLKFAEENAAKIEIAREMKKRGATDKYIAEYTGLNIKEIKRIKIGRKAN